MKCKLKSAFLFTFKIQWHDKSDVNTKKLLDAFTIYNLKIFTRKTRLVKNSFKDYP